MRLFIAVEIDEPVRKRLAASQRSMRYLNAKITWVAPHNFHFTIKFLGETGESKLALIRETMERVASPLTPIHCNLRGLGQFPRVIWAGIHGEIDRLSALATNLDQALKTVGFPAENREFRAHLTLGRIKFLGDKEGLTRIIASHTNEAFGDVRVEGIHLIQSQLTPHGSVYTKLFTAHLKGAHHGSET